MKNVIIAIIMIISIGFAVLYVNSTTDVSKTKPIKVKK